MGVENARNSRKIINLVNIDSNQKKAIFSEIVWRLDSGANAFSVTNLEVFLTKVSASEAICSANWRSHGDMGNWHSNHDLIVELCKNDAELTSLNLGKWEVACGDTRDFANRVSSIPFHFVDSANQIAIPSIEIKAASC